VIWPHAESVPKEYAVSFEVRACKGWAWVHPVLALQPTRSIVLEVRAYSVDVNIKKKLHGLSPRANYTDRVTAASRRSDCQLLRIEGATWSA
jgi:hypothetical protein